MISPPPPGGHVKPPPLPPPLPRILPAKHARAKADKPSRYLKDLAKFKNLLFAARSMVDGLYSGRHPSRLKGASPEFAEYRRYTPGDPTSAIDWKAFARTDRHYIKLTEKETDMHCHMLLDSSASMEYAGSGAQGHSKFEYASYLAAAISYLIVRQGDKVSLTLFNEKVVTHVQAGGTFPHLYRLLKTLEAWKPRGREPVSAALRKTFGLLRRRGLLIVISDFYDDEAALFRALAMYTHRNFEVVLFHIMHEEEYHLPAIASARFVDAETGAEISCHTNDLRRAYDENISAFTKSLCAGARARRMDYDFAHTGMPYDQVLRRHLARRELARA